MTKHSPSVALKELLSHNTSKQPSLSLDNAVRILRAGLPIKSDPETKKWFHANQDRGKAALALLVHLLNPPLNRNQKIEAQSQLLGLALSGLEFLHDAKSRELVKDLMLNVAHPDYLRMLSDKVLVLFGSNTVEKWICDAVLGDNQLHIVNALHLVYFAFEVSPETKLSEAATSLIAKRAKELQQSNELNPLLVMVLNEFGKS